jgi:hypothetical protein
VALARSLQGRARLRQGRIAEGLALLDEAMVTVKAEALAPIVPAIVYCILIEGCRQVYALDRCREWTAVLSSWCESQPQLVAFNGVCLVHRVEVLELEGDWDAAVEEARLACLRVAKTPDPFAAPKLHYQKAEMHRLRGGWTRRGVLPRRIDSGVSRSPECRCSGWSRDASMPRSPPSVAR